MSRWPASAALMSGVARPGQTRPAERPSSTAQASSASTRPGSPVHQLGHGGGVAPADGRVEEDDIAELGAAGGPMGLQAGFNHGKDSSQATAGIEGPLLHGRDGHAQELGDLGLGVAA